MIKYLKLNDAYIISSSQPSLRSNQILFIPTLINSFADPGNLRTKHLLNVTNLGEQTTLKLKKEERKGCSISKI